MVSVMLLVFLTELQNEVLRTLYKHTKILKLYATLKKDLLKQ